jgi:hypothetical protein
MHPSTKDGFISLGKKPGEHSKMAMPKEPAMFYPSIHISSDSKIEFPSEGEAVIQFKKIASSHNTREGSTSYSCELEIHAIKVMGGGMKEKDGLGKKLDDMEDKKNSYASEDDEED